jgi:formylglycine-generating enzyme required for sulfatase activity
MTAARSIEAHLLNWNSLEPGTGQINRGHTDSVPLQSLEASTNDNPCAGTQEESSCSTSGFSQKRTHTLGNGQVIWDFSGNVWEWVDWTVPLADKAYYSADGDPKSGWREWSLVDTRIGASDTMNTSTWQSAIPGLDSSNAIGQYLAAPTDPGTAIRGGFYEDTSDAGIYALSLGNPADNINAALGFRCAKSD